MNRIGIHKRSEQHDITRLPLWARDEFHLLEQRIEQLRQEVNVLSAHPKTRIIVEPYDEFPRYQDEEATVRFRLDDKEYGEYIDVKLAKRWGNAKAKGWFEPAVDIMGSRSVVLLPRSGNTLEIRIAE